jgi:AcrR family transcriptional regulator
MTAAPARGTRPRNRRALIVDAATELFSRRGFDQIGMSDIAEAVAIGPSALYRHFSGKQDLLHEVIVHELIPVRELVEALDLRDRATAVPRLAAVALDHRRLGVLWQREARHLSGDDHAVIREEIRAIGATLAERVRAARPDLSGAGAALLGWSVISVVTSNSFHRLELPRAQHEQVVGELIAGVLDAPVPEGFGRPLPKPPARGLTPGSRREALLAQAVRMFAEQGYTGVGIEDVGAAVGIAGASIYNHFPTKRDMLTTALERGAAALFMDLSAVYADASDPADALNRLARSYTRFALRHHDVLSLMITDLDHLPEQERHACRQAQHDYVGEWVHLFLALDPGQDPVAARIRVQAALSIANDAARTPRLHTTELDTAVATLLTRFFPTP